MSRGTRLVASLAACALVLLAVPAGLFTVAMLGAVEEPPALAASSSCFAPAPESAASVAGLDPEQVANARVIIDEGKRRGLPPYAWVVAIATARQESVLRNLPGGHGSSVGLFQLIQVHGTAAERQDPLFSTRWFYDGLERVEGWQDMPVTVAAQRVQRSAHPNAYAQWEGLAREVVTALEGATAVDGGTPCGIPITGTECPPNEHSATWEPGLVTDSVRLARCMYVAFGADPYLGSLGGYAPGAGHIRGSDHYTGRALDLGVREYGGAGRQLGDRMAQWLVVNHEAFGVKQVIWNGRIWDVRRPGGWRAYLHPSGRYHDDSLQHRNHVHVGVFGQPRGVLL